MLGTTYPKSIRICSKLDFELLLKRGRSYAVSPLRIRYTYVENHPSNLPFMYAVSAPKRLFKKAVDRNKIKRQLKESIRKNRHLIDTRQNANSTCLILLSYTLQHKTDFKTIEDATIKLFTRLNQSNE